MEIYKGFRIGSVIGDKWYAGKNINGKNYYLHTNNKLYLEDDYQYDNSLLETVYHKELSDVYKAIDKHIESTETSNMKHKYVYLKYIEDNKEYQDKEFIIKVSKEDYETNLPNIAGEVVKYTYTDDENPEGGTDIFYRFAFELIDYNEYKQYSPSSNQQLVIVTNTQTIKEDLEDDKEYNILYEQDYIKVTSENKMVAMFSRDVAKYIYIERS